MPIRRVELLEITCHALLDLSAAALDLRAGDVAIAVVHGLELGAVDGHAGGIQQTQLAAEGLRKALKRHGRRERIVIDGSQTNREAILSCDTESRLQDRSGCKLKPIRIRQSQYLNNRIEEDQRAIKRRVRSMLGFTSADSARVIMGGIELIGEVGWSHDLAGKRLGVMPLIHTLSYRADASMHAPTFFSTILGV